MQQKKFFLTAEENELAFHFYIISPITGKIYGKYFCRRQAQKALAETFNYLPFQLIEKSAYNKKYGSAI